ncbi:hypothetical protein H7686_0002270 [Candidatus Phytoplasma asiaticum]|uniref:Group II intron reverse transcriptase/maturase n=1 Tax=Candidatus Phytoplasma asiaticum TaxID=2763338 RepID=A0AAX3B927_9MOLU|nr:hypothetical protein ['Parthenium hysterophorus' phyllody phytoplasma]UQV27151.1 hypothetical protein H7686_0002270 ['Parthenium hysterophorus' phyllody phytoplasma]
MSTTVSIETKLSRTRDKIQYCSAKGHSLKRELQQGMNNFYNMLTAFNKIATNKGAGKPGVDNETIDGINLGKLERYHQEYVNNGYNPKPVKRILIPSVEPKNLAMTLSNALNKDFKELITLSKLT